MIGNKLRYHLNLLKNKKKEVFEVSIKLVALIVRIIGILFIKEPIH